MKISCESAAITAPAESLCDTCKNSQIVTNGYASFFNGETFCDYKQRYCDIKQIAIHFNGFSECEYYKTK